MKRFLRREFVVCAIGFPVFALAYYLGLWDVLPLWAFVIFAIGTWATAGWIADQLGLH